jgi:hypothetical protein
LVTSGNNPPAPTGNTGRAFFISPNRSETLRDDLLSSIKSAAPRYEVEAWYEVANTDSIGHDVVKKILHASVIFADLSDRNPNVYYEVAIAHSFGVPVVLLMAEGQKSAFDIHDQRVFNFGIQDERLKEPEAFRKNLRDALAELARSTDRPITPVSVAISSIGWSIVGARLSEQYGGGLGPREGSGSGAEPTDEEWRRRARDQYLDELRAADVDIDIEVVSPNEGVGTIVVCKKGESSVPVHIQFQNGTRMAIMVEEKGNKIYVKKPRGSDNVPS